MAKVGGSRLLQPRCLDGCVVSTCMAAAYLRLRLPSKPLDTDCPVQPATHIGLPVVMISFTATVGCTAPTKLARAVGHELEAAAQHSRDSFIQYWPFPPPRAPRRVVRPGAILRHQEL